MDKPPHRDKLSFIEGGGEICYLYTSYVVQQENNDKIEHKTPNIYIFFSWSNDFTIKNAFKLNMDIFMFSTNQSNQRRIQSQKFSPVK